MTFTLHAFDALLLCMILVIAVRGGWVLVNVSKSDLEAVNSLLFTGFVLFSFAAAVVSSMFFSAGHLLIPLEWYRILWKNIDICILLIIWKYIVRIERSRSPLTGVHMNKDTLLAYLFGGGFAALGGLANYFYNQSITPKPFTLKLFLMNLFLSFFVGILASALLPVNTPQRDGLVMVAGYSAMKILEILEASGPSIITKYFRPRT